MLDDCDVKEYCMLGGTALCKYIERIDCWIYTNWAKDIAYQYDKGWIHFDNLRQKVEIITKNEKSISKLEEVMENPKTWKDYL